MSSVEKICKEELFKKCQFPQARQCSQASQPQLAQIPGVEHQEVQAANVS